MEIAGLDARNNAITWDVADIRRRLCHALDVADQTVKCLAATGYTDSEDPALSVRPEKIISETALLLFVASGVEHPDVSGRVDSIARLLDPHARSTRMLTAMCMQPALALDYAQAHVFLSKLGFPNLQFDTALRQTAQSQAFRGCERLPYRTLEQAWTFDLWRGLESTFEPSNGAIALHSSLNFPMDLLKGSRDDIYAFTHALMYWGRFNCSAATYPRPLPSILSEAESLLARCLDEQDYDVAGELLLAWPLTGEAWSVAAAFGFRVLARVEDLAGFLPTPITRLDRVRALHGDERANYSLATAYHTVYVMGLLCASILRSQLLPPVQIRKAEVRSGAVRAVQEILCVATGRTPHWLEDFNALRDDESNALASFLFDVALCRKVTAQDFEGLRKLLEVGDAWALTESPAASQAAEMLERLATVYEPSRI